MRGPICRPLARSTIAAALLSLSLGLGGCRGSADLSIDRDADTRVQQALERGQYATAERDAAALTSTLESRSVSDSRLGRALDLLVEALVGNGKAGEPSTLTLAERAVTINEKFQPGGLELARSLDILGSARLARGEFALALPPFERALTIRKAKTGPAHPSVADTLDSLAQTLIRLERFADARRALEQSQAIRSKQDPASARHTLELFAALNRYEGDYRAALSTIDRALALQREMTPDHPRAISMLHLRGDVLWLQGNVEGAQRSWTEALSLAERALGPSHPDMALILRKQAAAAEALGDPMSARGLRERGLRVGEPLAPCHPERSNLLSDFGRSLIYDGEYSKARANYELALDFYRRCFGEKHSLTATALHNLADVSHKMGDLAEAERFQQRALEMWRETLGADHPYVARAMDALAEVLADQSRHARARDMYVSALNLRKKTLGSDHPDVARTLGNLAHVHAEAGEIVQALRNVNEAIGIYKKTGVGDEPDHFARVLELHGLLEVRRRNFLVARTSVQEVLRLRERNFGPSHPLVATSLAQLARIEFATNMLGPALRHALDAEQMGRTHLRLLIRYLPERQAMAYAAVRPRGLDLALSIVATGSSSGSTTTAQVFDSVIRSRGVVLDEMAARAQLVAKAGQAAAPAVNELHNTRQRFANLVLRSLEPTESVSTEVLESARRSKEQAERAVADLSAAAQPDLTQRTASLAEVRQSLPSGSALVSFVRYASSRSESAGPAGVSAGAYAVFVVRSDTDRIFVKALGSADSIDGFVSMWRSQIIRLRSEEAVFVAGQRLHKQVWAPLTTELEGISRVFIVPDGALNLVNFAALPSGRHRYMVEDSLLLHYLSTERDVVASATSDAPNGLLAIGGAEFSGPVSSTTGQPARSSAPERGQVTTTRQLSCTPGRSLQFQPLAGTADEVSEIGRLWSSFRPTPSTVLTGSAATEQAVRRVSAGRSVIHFATHGFVLTSGCELPSVAGTRAVGGLTANDRPFDDLTAENPLTLAGLALAHANSRRPGNVVDGDDGILTAEEVAGLNLQGTQWAVLSACDTGLGEVRNGEGVFGLRRAFQIAGVRTVIMSLWSVEDDATRQWMRLLYQAKLKDKLDSAEAVRAATLRMLALRRAQRLSVHPFYWGAFVAAGAWN